MKNFYYAFIIAFENGKHLASYDKAEPCENLLHALHKWDGMIYNGAHGVIKAANLCETKKEAVALSEAWNDAFVENGTHIWKTKQEEIA